MLLYKTRKRTPKETDKNKHVRLLFLLFLFFHNIIQDFHTHTHTNTRTHTKTGFKLYFIWKKQEEPLKQSKEKRAQQRNIRLMLITRKNIIIIQ